MHVVYRAMEISAIIPADHPNVQDRHSLAKFKQTSELKTKIY